MLKKLAVLYAPDSAPASGAAPAKPETPPADAGKKPAEPPDLTAAAEFVSRQLEGIKVKPPKKEEPEEPEEPAKGKGKPKEEEGKGKGKKSEGQQPPKKKVTPVLPPTKPEREPLSEERIAKAAAAGVAEAFEKRGKTGAKGEAEPAPEPGQERKVAVLQRMEKLYPDKYKGIAQAYSQSVKKLRDYAQRWEAEHPGQEFDESAEEHEAFFAENDVAWQDEDYTDAIADMRADKRVEEVNKATNEKLSSLEMKERLREAAPIIDQQQVSASRLFWGRMGKDFEGLLDERGAVNKEVTQKLQASDPVGFEIRLNNVVRLENEVATIYRLMNGFEDYDANNPMHRALGKFAEEQEKIIAAQPDAEKLDANGRRFLPADEYHKMAKNEAEKYYWTFSVADLAALRSAEIAAVTEKIVAAEDAKFQKWAAARGVKLPNKSEAANNGEGGDDGETPDDTDGKPVSPSGGVEPKMAAVSAAAAQDDPNPLSSFVAKQLGQR